MQLRDLVFFLVPVLWGFNFPIVKGGLPEFSSPESFNALRWVLAAVITAAIVAVGRYPTKIGRQHWRLALLIAGGTVINQITFANGIRLTTAGHSALILGLAPMMTILANATLGLEEVKREVWAGIALSLVGLVVLVRPWMEQAHQGAFLGDMLTLLTAITWAYYGIAARQLTLYYPAPTATAVTNALATAALLVIGAPALVAQSWNGIHVDGWMSALYSGGVTIGFGYMIWGLALRQLGTARTSVLFNLTPVVAVAGAWLMLRERLDAWQLLGAAMIIGGIAITRKRRNRVGAVTARLR
jgi:drug/metabolite transporter (DMT)-like permease